MRIIDNVRRKEHAYSRDHQAKEDGDGDVCNTHRVIAESDSVLTFPTLKQAVDENGILFFFDID